MQIYTYTYIYIYVYIYTYICVYTYMCRERERERERERQRARARGKGSSVCSLKLIHRSLLQNIVSFIGLFCKRDYTCRITHPYDMCDTHMYTRYHSFVCVT